MKKIVFFVLIIIFQHSFSQKVINFQTESFEKILELAKKENKLVFLDAYASWCGPCKIMERNVFTDSKVADFYNTNFLNVRIDMEKGDGPKIAAKYGIRSYPTLLFLNANGEIVGKELGYLDADHFLDFGKKNNNPKLVNSNLKDEYLKGNLDQPTLLKFISMYETTEPELAKQASEKYFSKKKDKSFSADEVNALLKFTQSIDDPNYKVFVANKDEITKLLEVEKYNQFDNYLKLMKIFQSATDSSTKIVDDSQVFAKAGDLFSKSDLVKSLNIYKLSYYASNQNFPEFENTALEYYANPNEFSPQELISAAFVINKNSQNPKALRKATEWVEKVVMGSENFETTRLLAQLYHKIGKKEESKMFAGMALNFAKEQNLNYNTEEDILNQ